MAFCGNHNTIYFDTLCRTKKAETLLSLIHATYQTKLHNKNSKKSDKEVIAEKLEYAYELFKFDSGTYDGSVNRFESQYTIGHEMGIWKNSDLDLTDLAIKVAQGNITVKDYMDIVFLNYIQPVKGKIIHILYHLLSYMKTNNLTVVSKEQMKEAYNSVVVGAADRDEIVNSVFNFLIGTNYFKKTLQNELAFNSEYNLNTILSLCDTTYLDVDYEIVKEKFSNLSIYLDYLLNDHSYKSEEQVSLGSEMTSVGENVILYGVPGCGKSHTIKTEYCNEKSFMERVVFHPDYTYSDFIGQILPVIEKNEKGEEKISYKFTVGPFTKILKKANKDKNNMYYLIIEEINRGNAPAIFGDVFQLLDRDNGVSEYGITNFDIAKEVYDGDIDHEVKIPRNLTILATMNTADQNVFTLDTAFKRRWIMRSIKNDITSCDHADECIAGTNVTWYSFAKKINDLIIDLSDGNLSSEDNRLGAYFIKSNDLKSRKTFGEKVLMYLWNDAFKYNRGDVFSPEYKTLEDLLTDFETKGFAVFNSNLKFDEYVKKSNENVDEGEYLKNKSQVLVDFYMSLREKVIEKIPNAFTYTTPSKQYIGIGSDDNPKNKSFAEIKFKTNSIVIEIEKPLDEELQKLGSEIPNNGHHDHYFKIETSDGTSLEDIVSAIVDSYEQLKG